MTPLSFLSGLAVLPALALGGASTPEAVSAQLSFPDHTVRAITLQATRDGKPAPAGDDGVVFRIVRDVYPWAGTPHATDGTGTIDVPAGYVDGAALPVDYVRVSDLVYTQRGGNYGARALEKKDIYPRAGDLPGAWLSQAGDDNFVKLEFPRVRAAVAVRIYETLNPGGVFRVKVHSRHGETMSVFTEGGANFERDVDENGAAVMTIHFEATHFDVTFATVHVDASKKWRGIDAVEVVGQLRQRASVPGDMFGDKLNFVPSNKVYGCDGFSFAAHDGKGGEWSNRANVKVCYGCPKNAKTGQVCSGAGKCHMAECVCQVGFKGDACEISQCPRSDGKICGGKGNCVKGQCSCFKEWAGEACDTRRHVARCGTCNDPHYYSFDGSRFSYYETGESLAFEWRHNPGPKLVVAQHLRNCGSRAYKQAWSPISCVDGASIRYGDDVVTWKYSSSSGGAAGSYINCQRVTPAGTWQNVGAHGLQIHQSSGGMQVRIGDWFTFSVNNGCYHLVTSIPRSPPNSNEIVGMCGNYDGIARNDAGGAEDWVAVPRFPTDALNPLPKHDTAKIKRQRAIAWGKFFEPKTGCDLFKCNKCAAYLNYNAFPLKYGGAINQLAEAAKIETQIEQSEEAAGIADEERFTPKDIEDPERNGHLITMVSTLSREASATGVLKDGRVGVDGDPIPANIDVNKLPSHIIGAPYELLYKGMHMDTCLQFLGDPEFDACFWDACSLHTKAGGGLTVKEALTRATEMNVERRNTKIKAREERTAMRKALDDDEEKEEAADKA
jgi:hypothetical protein